MLKHGKSMSTRKKWLILLIILLLIIGIICYLRQVALLSDTKGEGKTDVVKNDSSISIPGYEGLTLSANTKKQKVSLPNPAENTCYFVITLSLEDGTVLWKSDYIEPGETSKPIKLTTKLSAGNYPALMKYECFKLDESKTPLNGAEIKLTLRVK